jgi:hypothetical protein
MVQMWCSLDWDETHNALQEQRLMVQSHSHHQGSRSLNKHADAWVHAFFIQVYNFRLGMISNHLVGFLTVGVTWWPALLHLLDVCIGHKGKATSDVTYNPEGGPKLYSNLAVYSRLMSTLSWHKRSMSQITIRGARTSTKMST